MQGENKVFQVSVDISTVRTVAITTANSTER